MIKEIKIPKPNKGITTDLRDDLSYAQLLVNFDAHTFRNKLVPYRSSESGDDDANNRRLSNYAMAYDGTNWNLYALGQISSSNSKANIVSKALASQLDDATWTAGVQQTGAGVVNKRLFVYYHKTGKIYFASGTQYLMSFTPNGGASNETERDLTAFTNIAQGLVHSKDDILYIPYDNKILKNDNGSYANAALTLPTHYKITSICEYGNFLAIAATPLSGIGNSRVYLWDRDSSLTTISESIDWGDGLLHILEEVDGYLIGISYVGGSNILVNSVKIVFRAYSGGQPQVFKELISETTTLSSASGDLPLWKQKVSKDLFFQMAIKLSGANRFGVWKVGRASLAEPFSVSLDRTPNNDTALASTATLEGFYLLGDYMFQGWFDTTHQLTKTDDQNNHAQTSIYETTILNFGDASKTKQLLSVTVMHEFLPTNGKIIVAYKKDEETSYTTILTNTTDNSISQTAINIESSGVSLPEFKEIAFRIEFTRDAATTGDIGAFTGLKVRVEEIEKDII